MNEINMNTTKERLYGRLQEMGFNLDNFAQDYETCIDNYEFEYNCLNAEMNDDFIDYCFDNWK